MIIFNGLWEKSEIGSTWYGASTQAGKDIEMSEVLIFTGVLWSIHVLDC